MRIKTTAIGIALATLAMGMATSHAAEAECFDDGTNFPCTVERDADGSFTATSAGDGTVMFLVDESAGEAERVLFDVEQNRSFRGGYYRRLDDTPGCWQDIAFEDSIFCVWE